MIKKIYFLLNHTKIIFQFCVRIWPVVWMRKWYSKMSQYWLQLLTLRKGHIRCLELWTQWCEWFLVRLAIKMSRQQELWDDVVCLQGTVQQMGLEVIWQQSLHRAGSSFLGRVQFRRKDEIILPHRGGKERIGSQFCGRFSKLERQMLFIHSYYDRKINYSRNMRRTRGLRHAENLSCVHDVVFMIELISI